MADSNTPENKKALPWINITAQDYHIPEDFASELAAIVIEWGRFEMALVGDTSTMMVYPNIQSLAFDPPRSFKQKIQLWKKCIYTLYPTVDLYKNWAREICSKGKIVSRHRNRLIHGIWGTWNREEPGTFRVTSYKGLQYASDIQDHKITTDYVKALHADIKEINKALMSLMANRMLHAHQGLLTASPVQEP